MDNFKMDDLMSEIREITAKQKAASRVDEIRVMRTMLNDPNYNVSIYDKNKGFIGTRCPREEALKFIVNTTTSITGLDNKSASELADNYEFTKKDASFFIENNRDFTYTYINTGRKLPIVQSDKSEAAIFVRHIETKDKPIPNNQGEPKKNAVVQGYDKIVCKSKKPKYYNG